VSLVVSILARLRAVEEVRSLRQFQDWLTLLFIALIAVVLGVIVYKFLPGTVGSWVADRVQDILGSFP
jgi:hypothetical protein